VRPDNVFSINTEPLGFLDSSLTLSVSLHASSPTEPPLPSGLPETETKHASLGLSALSSLSLSTLASLSFSLSFSPSPFPEPGARPLLAAARRGSRGARPLLRRRHGAGCAAPPSTAEARRAAPPTPRSTSTTVPWLDPVEGDQIYGGPAPDGGSRPDALPDNGSTASPVAGVCSGGRGQVRCVPAALEAGSGRRGHCRHFFYFPLFFPSVSLM